jgi:hypothetical protein
MFSTAPYFNKNGKKKKRRKSISYEALNACTALA